MRAIICFFIMVLYGALSEAAGIFEDIDSVIEESIDQGVKVQLIDAKIDSVAYIAISARTADHSPDLLKLEDYYIKQGFPYIQQSFKDYSQIIVKLPVGQQEKVLQTSITNIGQQSFGSLTITVMGPINQQRVLGNLNRFYSNAGITIRKLQPTTEFSAEIVTYNFPFAYGDKQQEFRQVNNTATSLITGFLLCQLEPDKLPLFRLDTDGFKCSAPTVARQGRIDEKLVANYKSDLIQRLRYINTKPFEWLQLLGQFSSEKGYEQFLAYYKGISDVSIDDVINLYHDNLLEAENPDLKLESTGSKNKYNFTQSLEDRFEVETFEIEDFDERLGFTFSINAEKSICMLIDCDDPPYYLTIADNRLSQTLSFVFSSINTEQVLSYINEKFVPFLLRQEGVQQRDLMVAVSGDYTVEQLDGLFFALGKLKPSMSLSLNQQEPTGLSGTDVVSWQLPVTPGDQGWAASELIYYMLMANLGKDAEVVKDNSLISLNPVIFFNVDRFSTTITMRPVQDISDALNAIQSLEEKQFKQWKNSLLNNLKLQDNQYQIELLSTVFALENYREQLSQAIKDLTLTDFQLFTERYFIEQAE